MIFYFWQNMPAMHQVPYQRELVRMGHRVILCVDRMMLDERAAMGWQPEVTEGIEMHVSLDSMAAMALIDKSPVDSVHLISGVRGVSDGGRLTRYVARKGRRVAWIVEAWDSRGPKGKFRHLLFALEAQLYRRSLSRIFAMGEMGVSAYRSIGYPRELLEEFNYVTSVVPSTTAVGAEFRREPFVFGYVGALIGRKRVDLLLRSLAAMVAPRDSWMLEIHGDGPDKEALKLLAEVSGISDRIRWCGSFSSSHVAGRIAGLDALVLPSDFDGWGVVINEALLCGVPVVVSDQCGASCIPRRHGWGYLFRAGDMDGCAAACRLIMQSPPTVDVAAIDDVIGTRATARRLIEVFGDA